MTATANGRTQLGYAMAKNGAIQREKWDGGREREKIRGPDIRQASRKLDAEWLKAGRLWVGKAAFEARLYRIPEKSDGKWPRARREYTPNKTAGVFLIGAFGSPLPLKLRSAPASLLLTMLCAIP